MTPHASALVAPELETPHPTSAVAEAELQELRREVRALLPPWRIKALSSASSGRLPELLVELAGLLCREGPP
ncbi:hypothetical protein CMI47_02780 [Candidatus Pacearchaeota archaeon]|nr:hypothetical protein [Candidatus Pacearchaeota archaeon]